MGAYSRVPITWRGIRAVRAIGCLRYSHPGRIADVVKRPVVLRNGGGVPRGRDGIQKGGACPTTPRRRGGSGGLAWNSGGAGTRSVAVGLHQVLGVGELVELIDVGLGNHDVDGREHE